MSEIELGGYVFREICRIVPELDENSSPIEYSPKDEYNNILNISLHGYGNGPFCRFRIPAGIAQQGVYAVFVDGNVKYVGECDNLSSRWNIGYGNISPRNCYVHGQSTNCRINNLILTTYKSGSRINLYFHESKNRFRIENKLIEQLDPLWNIKHVNKMYLE